MPTDPIHRDMGRHDAQIDNLEGQVSRLVDEVHEIRKILDQANGGWRVIMWVAGASSAAGAVVSWAASKLHISI